MARSTRLVKTDRTDGQTDMARSTRSVKLIKNIYTLWGRKLPDQEYIYLMGSETLPLPVAYFPTNLVYPFTLRVTGINRENMSCLHGASNGYNNMQLHRRNRLETGINICINICLLNISNQQNSGIIRKNAIVEYLDYRKTRKNAIVEYLD